VIAPWHTDYPGRIVGSVYAAGPGYRTAFAVALADAGLGVHVDVMADAEGLPVGVSLAELQEISDRIRPARVDVHLIGSAAFVDEVLAAVLAVGPARVFLPWAAFTDRRAIAVRAARATAWIALWQEWPDAATAATPPWPAGPDGVLVMLIEPGTRDRCQIPRLDIAAACAPRLPVMVDGGVTEAVAPHCVSAGIDAMVVGRALLALAQAQDHRKETVR
jgi:pentose-5-phosphate-3-epimerase